MPVLSYILLCASLTEANLGRPPKALNQLCKLHHDTMALRKGKVHIGYCCKPKIIAQLSVVDCLRRSLEWKF